MQRDQRPRPLHEVVIDFDLLKRLAKHGHLIGLQVEHTFDPRQSVIKYHLSRDPLEYFGVVSRDPDTDSKFDDVMLEVYKQKVPEWN